MAPLIPYIDIPQLPIIDGVSIKPFGTLVAIGVYVGSEIARRQGERLGLDAKVLASFTFYILVGGFVGGHVLDSIFYHPSYVLHSPLSLLKIWDGQSSFGGFTGAFIGLVVWKLRFKHPTLPYADVVGSAFPIGWVFGRMGCSVAHDHPGLRSTAWYAVQYPGGGRLDLGLYEMLLTIPLAVAFLLLMKKRRPWGFYLGVMCTAYAPTRFALDFLRAPEGDVSGADPRYAGLTPAQWACLMLLSTGLYFLYRTGKVADMELPAQPPPIVTAGISATSDHGAGASGSVERTPRDDSSELRP